MATWPATLPLPLIASYSGRRAPTWDTIESDRGTSIFRPKQARPPVRWSVVWHFTEEQMEEFETWFEANANPGTFTMSLRVGKIDPYIAPELVDREVHFVEQPSIEIDAETNGWRVSAELEAEYAA